MRSLFSCLAVALLAGFIGCSEPAAPPTAPAGDASPAAGSDTKDEHAAADAASPMTEVSLDLPAMT